MKAKADVPNAELKVWCAQCCIRIAQNEERTCSMAKPITHAVTPNSIPPVPNGKPDLYEPCSANCSLPRCAIRRRLRVASTRSFKR